MELIIFLSLALIFVTFKQGLKFTKKQKKRRKEEKRGKCCGKRPIAWGICKLMENKPNKSGSIKKIMNDIQKHLMFKLFSFGLYYLF